MTLEELGAALRAEREKRGLSIEDVANHLKIGARLLRALEEGDASSLPHLAYAKGFIRSYSSYLGMAAEEVNEAVCALGGTSPAVPQPVYTPEESLAPGRSLKWLGVLIVLALVAGGAYLATGRSGNLSRQTRRLVSLPPLQTPDSAGACRAGRLPPGCGSSTRPNPAAGRFLPGGFSSPEVAPVAARFRRVCRVRRQSPIRPSPASAARAAECGPASSGG
ncbi:MAG: helix-turn-helix domain-containing protein [Desulfovibrio fairfieldensis]